MDCKFAGVKLCTPSSLKYYIYICSRILIVFKYWHSSHIYIGRYSDVDLYEVYYRVLSYHLC